MTELLAIVGSTCGLYADAAPVICRTIEQHKPRAVVSGGAPGVDTWAAIIAKTIYKLPVIECQPAGRKWEFYRPRDLLIAELCTRLVRVVSARSTTYGSGWTRDRAAEMGKPTEEHEIA